MQSAVALRVERLQQLCTDYRGILDDRGRRNCAGADHFFALSPISTNQPAMFLVAIT
jgi:hypothetical protein